jgi:hypothetical protein
MKRYSTKKVERPFEFYTPQILRDNKGIALVMVLILSFISLAIMSGLVYMVTSGTQVSGVEKRYSTALGAGESGVDVIYQVFSSRGNPYSVAEAALINFNLTVSPTCLLDKLNKTTDDWNIACDSSLTLIPGTPGTYDMAFQRGANPVFAVYTKIVDTVEGNTVKVDEGLVKSGVVLSNSGEVSVMHIPYLYTVEIDAENTNNPTERAKLSALCQY